MNAPFAADVGACQSPGPAVLASYGSEVQLDVIEMVTQVVEPEDLCSMLHQVFGSQPFRDGECDPY
ncbi:hypothetical protein [Streptomyces sp. NPDC005438]|uniref:hypothetical protein n=1 Tax=Streptomyces sp. NPDC005438 TaxID=3156880 RepID=UPI0033B7502B